MKSMRKTVQIENHKEEAPFACYEERSRTMELQSIHHIALNVMDYEAAKGFYAGKLGFQVLGEYVFPSGTRRMDLRLGGCQLELFSSPRFQPRPDMPLQGYRHLAFRVTDIHKAVEALKALGIEVEPVRPDPMAGGLMTFFRDPEGLELELHE